MSCKFHKYPTLRWTFLRKTSPGIKGQNSKANTIYTVNQLVSRGRQRCPEEGERNLKTNLRKSLVSGGLPGCEQEEEDWGEVLAAVCAFWVKLNTSRIWVSSETRRSGYPPSSWFVGYACSSVTSLLSVPIYWCELSYINTQPRNMRDKQMAVPFPTCRSVDQLVLYFLHTMIPLTNVALMIK